MDDGESPPPELVLGWQLRKWGGLPDVGGYLDQDGLLMERLTAIANIYDAVSRVRSMTGAQIHQLSDGERRIIKMLRDNGLMR